MKKNNFHTKALISHDKTELIGTTKRKGRKKEENKTVLFIANIYYTKIIANIFLNYILDKSKLAIIWEMSLNL